MDNYFSEEIEKLKKSISYLEESGLLESIKTAVRMLGKVQELDEKYVLIMTKAGWPPIADLTYGHINSIVDAYEKSDFDTFKKELDDSLTESFDKDFLEEKVTAWKAKKILKHRVPILEAVIKAHLNDDFILSIPVMLTQIEGLIAEYVDHKGKLNGQQLQNYFKELKYRDGLDDGFEICRNFLSTLIYKKFEWGLPIPSSLSRHAILHGACTDYGNKINSVKTLALFDFIIFCLQSHNGDS